MDSHSQSERPRQYHRRPQSNPWAVALLLFVVGMMAWNLFGAGPGALHNPDATPRSVSPRPELLPEEWSTINLFREASPSVVFITTTTRVNTRDRFRRNILEIKKGEGSGFLWNDDGHVVTNAHVVESGQFFAVTLSDHSTWSAQLVGMDPYHDLAVLKIDAPASRLPALPLGSSEDLEVGQKVFAIGNPFGLDHTLTTGIISGLNREIRSAIDAPIAGVIQTDAAINPGNSGGPLLDSGGRLIGVNTAIVTTTGAFSGVGFAIPVATVNRKVPELIRYGKPRRAGLGIRRFRPQHAPDGGANGVCVASVVEGGAAERAGIQPAYYDRQGNPVYDKIVGLDGKTIGSFDDLYRLLNRHEVGDTVEVQVEHAGEVRTVSIRLQALD